MGAGKRRQIRKQICNILTEFVVTAYFEKHVEGSKLYSTAGEIMQLFPKPEVTTLYREETAIFNIPYYKCSKCGDVIECGDGGSIDHYKFCPICGRRIKAMEDKTLCQ